MREEGDNYVVADAAGGRRERKRDAVKRKEKSISPPPHKGSKTNDSFLVRSLPSLSNNTRSPLLLRKGFHRSLEKRAMSDVEEIPRKSRGTHFVCAASRREQQQLERVFKKSDGSVCCWGTRLISSSQFFEPIAFCQNLDKTAIEAHVRSKRSSQERKRRNPLTSNSLFFLLKNQCPPSPKSISGNAAALAGNPGLIDAIQAKLDTIVGLPSGFIEEMPVEVGFFSFFESVVFASAAAAAAA